MKNILLILAVSILIFLGTNCTSKSGKNEIASQENTNSSSPLVENDSMEITGILICTHCYSISEKNTGLDHNLSENRFMKDCAGMCALQNYPIGVLSKNKQHGANVWVIRTSGSMFADYMSKEIKIKGLFIKDALIEPLHIEVDDNSKWITLL